MNQRVDRSSQGSFRAQCLQQHSGESSFVPDYSVQSLISQGECRSWMQRERSFTSAATCEKKNPDVSTGIQITKITVGQNRLFSKGAPYCLFLPTTLVSMEPCYQPGQEADLSETSPRKIQLCILWLLTLRLACNDGSCQLRLLSKDDVHAVSLSDRQNNGIVYTDRETKLGRGNHSSVLTTLNFS